MLATKLNKLNWIPWVYMLEGNDSHGLSSDCPCALRHMLARVLELFWETASWFLTIKPTHSAVFLEELEPAGKKPLESQVSCLTLQTTGGAEKHFWAQNAERQNPNCSELQQRERTVLGAILCLHGTASALDLTHFATRGVAWLDKLTKEVKEANSAGNRAKQNKHKPKKRSLDL